MSILNKTKAPAGHVERKAESTASDRVVAGTSHVVLILWSAIVVLPLLWTFMSSFKSSAEIFASPFALPSVWRFDNYTRAWTEAGIGQAFGNSLILVGASLVLVMLLGAMSAYVLARFKFWGNRFVYILLLAGNTFPVFLAMVPLFKMLERMHLLNTLFGLILTYVGFALAFTVFFLHSFFKNLPGEIAEAAAIDGAGEWRTFFQIMLPMAKPGLASVAIFNFLGLWNQFLIPVTINAAGPKVLSQSLAAFAQQMGYAVDFGALFAAVTITVIPVLVVYIIFQRQLQGSVSQGTSR
ncbi:carbohydrate ABC transporter permease [Arthrobacter sp. RAF14]|uniref:carbohydrate ABC transporter permease n=1 Tax=Arthrobacter sp. RAF14 TaxID=3233051 RepID=UPI003F92706D